MVEKSSLNGCDYKRGMGNNPPGKRECDNIATIPRELANRAILQELL